jgi:hypothetical protein
LREGLLDDALFSSFEVKALEAGIYFEDQWDIPSWNQVIIGRSHFKFFCSGNLLPGSSIADDF